MADTISVYNHTAKVWANQQVTLANIKFMLLNGASFDAANTAIASVSGSQVSGNGWASGGEAPASPAVTTVTTNDAKFDANDIVKAASGGSIGPASAYVMYEATADLLLLYCTFGSAQTATVGNNFSITFDAAGIITWTVT